MNYILLSTDGPISLYEVPAHIAKNLDKYCINFCDWVQNRHKAKKFRNSYFPEEDFINYLNTVVNPRHPHKARWLKTFGYWDEVPEEYKDLPYFNF